MSRFSPTASIVTAQRRFMVTNSRDRIPHTNAMSHRSGLGQPLKIDAHNSRSQHLVPAPENESYSS